MALEKFVSTEKSLGSPSWQKPQHILDAIKKVKSRSVAARAWCKGASPPDNSCPPSNKGKGAKGSGGGGAKGKSKGDKGGKGSGGGDAETGGGSSGVGSDSPGGSGSSVEQAKPGDGPLVKAARSEHKKALDKARKNLDKAQEKADAKFAETTKKFYEAKDAHFDASDRAAKLQEEHAGIIQRLSADPTNATLQQALERSAGMLEESSKAFESTHKAMEKSHKQREKVRQEMRSAVQKALRKECDSVNKEDGVDAKHGEEVRKIYGLGSHVGASQLDTVTAEKSRVIASRTVVQQEMKIAESFAMDAVNAEIHAQAMTTPIVFEESIRASASVRDADRFPDTDQIGQLPPVNRRASYTTLSANDNASTHVHEMAHHMEYSTPEVRELTNDFLASRTGGESLVQFSKKFPDVGYADDEVGSPDDFSKAFKAAGYSDADAERLAHYAGKRYDGTMTEVLTMGMELMYKDARTFAASDPEWFDLVFGVASGRILSKTRKARKEQRPYGTPS
jgi:hypothetical protein